MSNNKKYRVSVGVRANLIFFTFAFCSVFKSQINIGEETIITIKDSAVIYYDNSTIFSNKEEQPLVYVIEGTIISGFSRNTNAEIVFINSMKYSKKANKFKKKGDNKVVKKPHNGNQKNK